MDAAFLPHAPSPANAAGTSARPLALDRSRHAAPQLVEYLRERIISLELPPGAVLSRNDVAAQFGVSQTPVRDALMRLEEEGLVEVFAQHKTVVSRIDIHSARQAHFLRRSIEIEVVRTLAEARDAMLVRRLRETVARQKELLEAADYPEFVRTDQVFHRQMYEAAGVPDLWDTVRRHSVHIDRLRRLHLPAPGKAQAIVADHLRIVNAIGRGNPERAERQVRQHLSGTLSRVDDIRARYPSYVTN